MRRLWPWARGIGLLSALAASEIRKAMGLDGVELVMSIEEGFGVTITDAEAEVCLTPASVIDLVYGKLRASDERVCVSQRGFYLLRKGLMTTLGLMRSEVALDSKLPDSVLDQDARTIWASIRDSVQARSWPKLGRPRWMVVLFTLVSLTTFVGLWSVSHWLLGILGAWLVAFVCVVTTRGFCSRFPRRYARVRDLVPFAVTSEAIAWTRDQVAALVKRLVIEQLGLKPGEYWENAHFVKDLGMG